MQEIFKPIIGFEGIYEISNLGNVKSIKNNIILKPFINKKLYNRKTVSLHKKGVQKIYKVHRLVASAFIPNPKNKKCINHLDNDPRNNNVLNLEWVTHKENIQYAVKQGRLTFNKNMKGESHPMSKLTNKNILKIFKLIKTKKQKDIAKIFNVSPQLISKIVCGNGWRHLSKN